MVFKGIIAAATAAAMVVTPTVAAAAGSAAAAREIAPAGESIEGSEFRGGFIIPLLVIIAILLGILAALNDDDEDLPTSP